MPRTYLSPLLLLASFVALLFGFARQAHADCLSNTAHGTVTAVSGTYSNVSSPDAAYWDLGDDCPMYIVDVTGASGHDMGLSAKFTTSPTSQSACNSSWYYYEVYGSNGGSYTYLGGTYAQGTWTTWFGSSFCSWTIPSWYTGGVFSVSVPNSPHSSFRIVAQAYGPARVTVSVATDYVIE